MKAIVISGENHRFNESAGVIHSFLRQHPDIQSELVDDKEVLLNLNCYDVCIFGTGFTKTIRGDDGSVERLDDLTPEQERGLFDYVSGGGGLVDPFKGCTAVGWPRQLAPSRAHL